MNTSDIISSVDILSYIEQYCTDLKYENGEYWGLSPFKEEKTPSFSVNQEKQRFYDFSSGKGGNVIEFIKLYHKCDFPRALKILCEFAGVDNNYSAEKIPSILKVAKKYKGKLHKSSVSNPNILPETYMEIYEPRGIHSSQWEAEGITGECMDKFQVRFDPFSNRLVFPIRDYSGNIVNVCGRTLDEDFKEKKLRKYTYYKKWNGEMNVIYGLSEHLQAIKDSKTIILFEGSKSVMIAETWGITNTGAILTSHLSDCQFKFLIKLGCNVIFALDEDVSVANDKNISRLKRYVQVEAIVNKDKLLSEKMSPVDNGYDVWKKLYDGRIKI